MFKFLFTSTVTLILLSLLFTGCVSRELYLCNPNQHRENQYNVNDVDMSDLDENLTESEMMMTEEGDEKMERIEFPTSEYYSLPRSGRGTIKRTIYITDSYGSRVLGAGTRLYLNPITSYSKQWYIESYLGGNRMQKADSRLFNYLKFTAANSNGKFAFMVFQMDLTIL